jgi:hypothetical protein
MENNIEYWKNKIQKESGIPLHFFEINNIQELYTNKQKAKIKKLCRHFKHKLNVKQNIFIRKINKKYQKNSVTIYADSAYVLGGVTNWIFGWEKNGWKTSNKKPVLNQELWKELISLVRSFGGSITWQKVKGHSGHLYNDRADEIATTCAKNQ